MITIQDNELARSIGYQIKKYNINQFSKEELESVYEISLKNVDFTGKNLNVSLEQLTELRHLKSLYLQHFTIDEALIKIINELKEINELYLSQCNIVGTKKINLQQLKNLTVSFCENVNFEIFYMPEQVKFITKIDEVFELDKVLDKSKIKRLSINNANIKNFEFINDFYTLESLNIDGSKVDKTEVLNMLQKKINVSHCSTNLPIT